MQVTEIIEVFREGILVVLKIGGPMLVLSMIAGVTVSIFQAVTSIQEQTLSFAFKLAVVGSCLMIGGDWMLTTLVEYTERIFILMRGS